MICRCFQFISSCWFPYFAKVCIAMRAYSAQLCNLHLYLQDMGLGNWLRQCSQEGTNVMCCPRNLKKRCMFLHSTGIQISEAWEWTEPMNQPLQTPSKLASKLIRSQWDCKLNKKESSCKQTLESQDLQKCNSCEIEELAQASSRTLEPPHEDFHAIENQTVAKHSKSTSCLRGILPRSLLPPTNMVWGKEPYTGCSTYCIWSEYHGNGWYWWRLETPSCERDLHQRLGC